jgi:serine O-acetyltransferase
MTWKRTRELIRSDLNRRIEWEGRKPGIGSLFWVLLSPGAQATIVWRLECYLRAKGFMLPVKLLAVLNMVFYTTEIESAAQIDEGFLLLNPNGIMIHEHTKIGRNVTLTHQITLSIGPRPGLDVVNDYITLEENVVLSAGVRVVGNLVIGRNSWIGPNSVVLSSVPPNTMVTGTKRESLPQPVQGR